MCMTQGGPGTAFSRIRRRRLAAYMDHRMRSDIFHYCARNWVNGATRDVAHGVVSDRHLVWFLPNQPLPVKEISQQRYCS